MDDELADQRASIREDSDAIVERARGKADEVLKTARDQADRLLDGDPVRIRGEVHRERGEEDQLLQNERAIADGQLKEERDERTMALKELLRLEREATDEHLLIERARSDASVVSRDDVMAMVAHDLRSMLGGIALNAAMIVKDATKDGAAQAVLKRAESVQRLTARMNRLIGDLVDVASIEAGKLMVSPAADDAARLVRESVEAFQPSALEKGVALTAEVAQGSLAARFDHERVLQVLANLLSNAIKFTQKGGHVSLRLDRAEGQVRFAVSDTGPGIDASKHEAVFLRFWQADQSDRRGMGLGLFISRCIVQAHGGTIWVESKPDRGSTFCFTLPAG